MDSLTAESNPRSSHSSKLIGDLGCNFEPSKMASLWTSVRRTAQGWHLFIIFFLALFSLRYLTRTRSSVTTDPIPTLSKFTSNYSPSAGSQLEPATQVTLALILCNDDPGHDGVSNSKRVSRKNIQRSFQRQINQGVVLLKSIVVQEAFFQASSMAPVEVLVVSDRFENFQELDEAIRKDKWAAEFLERIRLRFVPVAYPSGDEWMRKISRPCATLLLFLDQLLPSYDSLIYVDTDLIFLRPVSELWSEFNHFTPETLAALPPCLHHYGTAANSVPFYGATGLNSGVMLMNLTRIRQTNWTTDIRQIAKDFSKQIKFGDQDVLNIYFNATPSKLHLLSCDWNFRSSQCQKKSFCLDPQMSNGISALHGNGLTFTKFGGDPMFRAIFSTFQRYKLTFWSRLEGLTSSLRQEVMRAQRNKNNKSACAHYEAFPTLLLNRMN